MLVVVEYWDVAQFFQSAFNFETSWCADVFQVDTAERFGNFVNNVNLLAPGGAGSQTVEALCLSALEQNSCGRARAVILPFDSGWAVW